MGTAISGTTTTVVGAMATIVAGVIVIIVAFMATALASASALDITTVTAITET